MASVVYWRLVYSDDSVSDEPLNEQSIRLANQGAVALCACRHFMAADGKDMRTLAFRLNLFQGERLAKPIWYRVRSLEQDFGTGRLGEAKTDITVIGLGWESEHTIDGKLFATRDGYNFIDCPQWAIDQTVLEDQIMNVYSGLKGTTISVPRIG